MFSTTDSYKGDRRVDLRRHQSSATRLFTPWIAAALAAGLSIATSWGQAQSNDLLPRYVMYPGIIGAICCGLFACACVFCFFILQKYDNYHQKHANDAGALKHDVHPIGKWPRLVLMGSGVAMVLTEGSYIYMLAFILGDDGDDYCMTFTQGTSASECSNGGMVVAVYAGIIGMLILAGLLYEEVVQEAVDYFDNRKELHSAGLLSSSSSGSRSHGRTQQQGDYGMANDGYDEENDKW